MGGVRLHFDCFSGLAGDMFLGACLDAGLPLELLSSAIDRLDLPGVGVEQRAAKRGAIAGVRFRVMQDGVPVEGPDPEEGDIPEARPRAQATRGLAEIRRLIGDSSLDAPIRERSLALFSRLAEAEAKIHGVAVDEVHFHEVGAIDAIVDLVGAATAVEHFCPSRVSCGPINVGSGSVTSAHGRLPVPAPATAELLVGLPLYGSGQGELVTPTGAVLLAELVDGFDLLPPMVLRRTGYGLGRRDTPGCPNAFRLLVGETVEKEGEVMVVECEIDDFTGEGFGFLMERLLEGPVLDVYFTSVQMKKNRPGTLVSVLCRREHLEEVAARLVAESGALGCRYHSVGRFEAERRIFSVETEFGQVGIKEGRLGGRLTSRAPEFEDCRRLAREHGVPWRAVYQAAMRAVQGNSS